MKMKKYKSQVVIGKQYSHRYSKLKGTAMSVSFYLNGCIRVGILSDKSTDGIYVYVDEPELAGLKENKKPSHGLRQDCTRQ